MNKKISIIGCGWLGLPLAKELVQQHYHIKGSTTSPDKMEMMKAAGIQPYLISLSKAGIEGPISEFLKDTEILIINIPPGLRKDPGADFVAQMQLLSQQIEQSEVNKVLFVSSTSVYKETVDIPTIDENSVLDGESSSAKQLIAAEQLFQNATHFESTILRFGGLIGEERHPAIYLSGKQNLQDPDAPINLIHQRDCIAAIRAIIKNGQWNNTFNAVAPQHPSKEVYYTRICKARQLPLAQFDHGTPSKGKVVNSDKVEQLLNNGFQHKL